MSYKHFIILLLHVGWMQTALTQVIPNDTALHTGKLSNGLTYYIRHNAEPKHQALLYLVIKAGSILEDDDQQGLAHFMEHMNFNGTLHYPKNDLEDFLQKAGVRFGADLNAYTNFDETVFQLPLPTDDPTLIHRGIGILRDWAQDALLDSIDIAQERGVVLEEERLGKGAANRLQQQYLPILLNHSRYSVRKPIGLHNILTTFQPATLRRFHHDWYRPDLEAAIVVGDIDVRTIEKEIRTQFGSLKNPSPERTRISYNIPLTGRNQFMIASDPEQSNVELDIHFKHHSTQLRTYSDYLDIFKRQLFSAMLAARFQEQAQEPGLPYIQAGANIYDYTGNLVLFSFDVVPQKRQLKTAFYRAWRLVEQAKRFGFTQQELDFARKNLMSNLDASWKEQNKTPSSFFVSEYQGLFLQGHAVPSRAWEHTFSQELLPGITVGDIDSITRTYFSDRDRDILLLAPEQDKSTLPDSATVTQWIQDIEHESLAPYVAPTTQGQLMPIKPKPGKIITLDSIPSLGVTKVTLSNGVHLILKPTTFQNDQILFTGSSPGGLSLAQDSDYLSAANAAALINTMGLGDFTPLQLQQVLAGKQANVGTYISARTQGIQGAANTADLETALQLLYLRFTQPRIDTTVFTIDITNTKASLVNKYTNPENVFADTVSMVLDNYKYRYRPITAQRIDSINLTKALSFYKARFADASGFTFVFVGSFNVPTILPLLQQYLGSLPSQSRGDTAIDLHEQLPPGRIKKIVRSGSEDKATVTLVLSGGYNFSSVNNVSLYVLHQALQIKLLQHLREAEAQVYTPSVQESINKYPTGRYSVNISFGCAPQNVNHLVNMVEQELDTLRAKGPDPIDVQKVKAAYGKQMEQQLQSNRFWLGYLMTKHENAEDPTSILRWQRILDQLTPERLHEDAQQYLTTQNFIQFELLPAAVNDSH